MPDPHAYDHLEETNEKFKIELPMRELAYHIVRMNYGVHRFLSCLIDARRDKLQRTIEEYQRRDMPEQARALQQDGDELADEIERLLLKGLI